MKEAQLWNVWLCLLIDFNLEFGPLQDDHRFAHIQGAMRTLADKVAAEAPVFVEAAGDIITDMKSDGFEL
eukprot:11099294-Prorocentrum_lima.AAC.1